MVLESGGLQTAFTRFPETQRLRAECQSELVAVTLNDGPRGDCRRLIFTCGGFVDLLTWLIVGLIAGLIASSVVGGIGFGIIGDMVVGMVGAVVGGWLFSTLRITSPIGGMPGNVVVAFVGAVVLLLFFRVLKPGRRFV